MVSKSQVIKELPPQPELLEIYKDLKNNYKTKTNKQTKTKQQQNGREAMKDRRPTPGYLGMVFYNDASLTLL